MTTSKQRLQAIASDLANRRLTILLQILDTADTEVREAITRDIIGYDYYSDDDFGRHPHKQPELCWDSHLYNLHLLPLTDADGTLPGIDPQLHQQYTELLDVGDRIAKMLSQIAQPAAA